jgi:hypothetical protein
MRARWNRLAWAFAVVAFPGACASLRGRTDVGNGIVATQIAGVAVDPQGFIYVAGTTGWNQFPTTPGPFSTFLGQSGNTYASGDVFVRKLEPVTYGIVYSVLIGGTGGSTAAGIAVDS